MAFAFYVGLDLQGQGGALALVEKAAGGAEEQPVYRLRRLERLEGGRTGEDLAEHVKNLIADRPYTGRTLVVVNKTDQQGQAVLDRLVDEGLTPIGVTVTEGDTAAQDASGLAATGGRSEDRAGFLVSRRALVGGLQELYRSGQIKLEEDTEAVMSLAEDLHAEQTGTAGSPLTLGAALACWFGEQHEFDPMEHLSGSPPPTGQARRAAR